MGPGRRTACRDTAATRDELLASAAGRKFGLLQGLLVLLLACGVTALVVGALNASEGLLPLAMGAMLIAQTCFVWWSLRHTALRQAQALDLRISQALSGPDGEHIAAAATVARGMLVRRAGTA
jgi:hypothetical protein